MRRKRRWGVFLVATLLLFYALGKRYVFPSVEQKIEEQAGQSTVHAKEGPDSRISVEKKEFGEGDSKVTFFAVDVKLGDARDLQTAFAHNEYGLNIRDSLSNMAEEHGAGFAVNGDYYGFRKDGIVLRDGVLYREDASDRECLVLYQDGTMGVRKESEVTGEELLKEGAWNVFSFGPVLVENGEIRPNLDDSYKVDDINQSISGTEPRTGIGYLGKNHFLFLIVDGRRPGYSRGVTFDEMAQLFTVYGCSLAYNLDGGSSVTLYQDGAIENRPCTKTGQERGISDAIYIAASDLEE